MYCDKEGHWGGYNLALKETFGFCSFLINFMDIDFHKVGTATRMVTGDG